MSWELYLPPAPPTRSRTTGRFLKGNRPANTGKRWADYMSDDAQQRAAKGWENLNKYRAHPKSPDSGRPPREVVALYPDGKYTCYDSIGHAAEALNCRRENIRRCCRENDPCMFCGVLALSTGAQSTLTTSTRVSVSISETAMCGGRK